MTSAALSAWRAAYRLLTLLAYPWSRWQLHRRARREPEYGLRIGERYGVVPGSVPSGVVWFHTVSAGEAIAAAPLIGALAAEFPQVEFLVTATTPAGSAQVNQLLTTRLVNVSHCYAPYDFPRAVARFFDAIRPRLIVLMETELWPNQLARASRDGIPVLLVNARLSARSQAGYARIAPLAREMIRDLRFIACQYPVHVERFASLGASAGQLSALGSVKFDVTLPVDHAARAAGWREAWGLDGRPVWIAGSTHAGEEAVVIEAHGQVRARYPEALLIIAPRHTSRAQEVAAQLEAAGMVTVRRSSGTAVDRETDVLLVDTMGELMYFYGLSQVAFLGGSLVSVGGHNPIEAAVCGQPLLMGPQTFNFPEVVAAFADAGCLTLVGAAGELAAGVLRYFGDPALRQRHAAAAREVVAGNRGAVERLLTLLRAEILAVSAGSGRSGSSGV